MPQEDQPYEYKAFISYSHRDEKWGRWLHRGIEGYKIPKGLIGRDTRYGPVPKRLFPVFRDREELPTASDLSKIINQALIDSSHLIVICSPNSAKSQWVNEEVKAFKKLGKQNRILCLIVDGEPNAANKPELGLEECFPPAVKVAADEDGNLTEIEAEPIAADAREGKDGKANALMKVLAGLLGLGFDEIKQRDLVRKQKRAAMMVAASLCLALVMGILAAMAFQATAKAKRKSFEAEQARDEAERLLYNTKIFQAANLSKENNFVLARKALLEAPERHRNFEWGYLMRKINPQLLLLEGRSIFYSPDGKRIVTSASFKDGALRIWDAMTGEQVAVLQVEGFSLWDDIVIYSPDGKRITTLSSDGKFRIWDAMTFTQVAVFRVIEGGPRMHGDIVFSHDRKRVAVRYGNKTVRILDAMTGELAAVLEGHSGTIKVIAYSPDDKRITTVYSDGTAKIWDATTGEQVAVPEGRDATSGGQVAVLEGHSGDIVIYSPDGKWVAATSSDKKLRVWDAETGKQVAVHELYSDKVSILDYSPDGKRIATSFGDGTIRIWDTTAASQVAFKGHTATINSIDFSPDGKQIVTGSHDGTARIWDVTTGEQVADLKVHLSGIGGVRTVIYSPDGEQITTEIVTAHDDGTAMIWDVTTGEQVAVLKVYLSGMGRVHTVIYSPDSEQITSEYTDGTARIWDVTTGEQVAFLEDQHTADDSFSPDGKRIVTSSGGQVGILDAVTGEQLVLLEGPPVSAISSVFSPDGKRVAASYKDNTARILDAAPWKDEDYPGDASMPFMQRYNLWSLQQHKKRKNAEQNRLDRILLKEFEELNEKYSQRALILTNMIPADAVLALRQSGDALECAKHLYLMQTPERKEMISEYNNGSDGDKRFAADILSILKRIERIKNSTL